MAALPVDLPYDEEDIARRIAAGPPESAEEYLLRVRYEANHIPGLMLSDVNPRDFDDKQTAYMPKSHDVPVCGTCCLPTPQWERKALADFRRIRAKLEPWCVPESTVPRPPLPVTLPPVSDTKRWRQFCFGPDNRGRHLPPSATLTPVAEAVAEVVAEAIPDDSEEEAVTVEEEGVGEEEGVEVEGVEGEEGLEEVAGPLADAELPSATATVSVPAPAPVTGTQGERVGCPPLLSILASLDHISSLKLLERHVRRVCGSPGGVSSPHCVWMYGLLARLELPLDPDTASSLRLLLKYCCRERASLCSAHRRVEEGKGEEEGKEEEKEKGEGKEEEEKEEKGEKGEGPSKRARVDASASTEGEQAAPADSDALCHLNLLILLVHRVFGQHE